MREKMGFFVPLFSFYEAISTASELINYMIGR